MIGVLLVDDHELFRASLRLRLDQEEGIAAVGEAGTGEQAVLKARALRPDVVLLDLVLPRRSGYDVIADLLKGDCCIKRSGVQSADIQASGGRLIYDGLHLFEGGFSRLVAAANPSGIA
jgi:DNA-binding NarL/FixJ family response regulator